MAGAITPETLLAAYGSGYFPMAESRASGELLWFFPEKRGVIPLEAFHIPSSLAKRMKKNPYRITTNKAFPDVIAACAAREETWINDEIIGLYCTLWEQGYAHSIECWQLRHSPPLASRPKDRGIQNSKRPAGLLRSPASADAGEMDPRDKNSTEFLPEDDVELVGGLYGVAIGGAFFGESMFSRAEDASKIALVHLVEKLTDAGYTLLDTQYVNDHLKQFGVIEIAREEYMHRLQAALQITPGNCWK